LISQGVRCIAGKAFPVKKAVSDAAGIIITPVTRKILFQGMAGSSVIFFRFRRMCSRTIPIAPKELPVIKSTPFVYRMEESSNAGRLKTTYSQTG